MKTELALMVAAALGMPFVVRCLGACSTTTVTYASCVYTAMPLVDAACTSAAAVQGNLAQCGFVSPGPQPAAVCAVNCSSGDAGCLYVPDAGMSIGGLLCGCQ